MNCIIQVNFNGGRKLKRVVDKYLGFRGFRLMVVDNGSTDGSVEGLKCKVIKNVKNLGFAAGANIGIREALEIGAERIILVNPDIAIGKLEIQKMLKNNTDIVSPVLKFQRDGKWIYDFGGKVYWPLGRTYHLENKDGDIDYVSGACMMIKRKVFEKIGYLDESFFMYFEDVDFCLRAKQAGFSVGVDREIVCHHDISEHRKTGDKVKEKYLLESNQRFIQKWVPAVFWPLAYSYLYVLKVRSGL